MPAGRFKKFGAFGPHFDKKDLINSFVSKILVNYLEKYPPQAGQKTSAGRIFPAGLTLPKPGLECQILFEGRIVEIKTFDIKVDIALINIALFQSTSLV